MSKKWYRTYVLTSAVGIEIVLCVVFGLGAGYFFDKKFATGPYGMILGFLFGCAAAAKRLYTVSKNYLKTNSLKKNDEDI